MRNVEYRHNRRAQRHASPLLSGCKDNMFFSTKQLNLSQSGIKSTHYFPSVHSTTHFRPLLVPPYQKNHYSRFASSIHHPHRKPESTSKPQHLGISYHFGEKNLGIPYCFRQKNLGIWQISRTFAAETSIKQAFYHNGNIHK